MDIFNFESLFIGGILLLIVLGYSKGVIEWFRNNRQPVQSVQSRLITKRIDVRGNSTDSGESTSTDYYCSFELITGERFELQVSGGEYGLLAEGDEGILTFQGTRYHGFQRA